MDLTREELFEIVSNFKMKECEAIDIKPLDNGLINITWFVDTNSHRKYVLQLINDSIFPNVDELMDNISYVSEHLYEKGMISLHLIETLNGKLYFKYKDKYFRLYRFISNTISVDATEDLEIIEAAGNYLGQFHMALNDVDVTKITDSIKDFHNTPVRFVKFINDVKTGNPERIKEAKEEIDFLMSFKDKVNEIENGLSEGYIPKRVTHNDTKLNNYLFNPATKKAVCLIDFDTIMVSSALYDFGDATRYLCNKAGESETDLNKVVFDLTLYEPYARGYLEYGKIFLNKKELELLPYSSLLMAIELSIRFLGDYLQNDVYFKIRHEKENLDRARNQIKVAKDIIGKFDQIKAIVEKYSK